MGAKYRRKMMLRESGSVREDQPLVQFGCPGGGRFLVAHERCTSSVCVVDGTGRIVREARVASEPEALMRFLGQLGLTRIGLEAGPLSQWTAPGRIAASPVN